MTRRSFFAAVLAPLAAVPFLRHVIPSRRTFTREWDDTAALVLPQGLKARWMSIGDDWYRVDSDGTARFDHRAPR